MSTLREAAQQALEALEMLAQPTKTNSETPRYKAHKAAITALRAALKQQEQEPVAWMITTKDGRHFIFRMNKPATSDGETLTPLYTAPPRREWQGLTEEDMEDLLPLYSDPSANTEMLEFAAAIEAKLKEKNHG